jgi:proteasome lid subunit RPN8/RPN11
MALILPRKALSAYDKRLAALEGKAYEYASSRISAFIEKFPGAKPEQVREFAIEVVDDSVGAFGDGASSLAADMYEGMAELSGVRVKPAVIDTSDVHGHIESEVRYQLGKFLSGDPTGFILACASKASDQVARRANQTMRLNAKRDGLRYARVPMGGETCSFCAMLASRGFDYKSAKTAGEGNHYHKNCRCKVIPGFDGMEIEGYDPDEWLDRWRLMEEIQADKSLTWNERQFGKLSVSEGMTLDEWRALRDSLEVDMARLATRGYKRAVKEAFGGNPPETALADIRRILRHRSGTPYEDLYAYDITNGKRLSSVTTSEVEYEVRASRKMKLRIKGAIESGAEVAMLHNHPGSSLPSAADIAGLKASGASFGVIACHDGSLYRYSLVGEPSAGYTISEESIRKVYDNRIARGKTEEAALAAIEDELGVKIEHIR